MRHVEITSIVVGVPPDFVTLQETIQKSKQNGVDIRYAPPATRPGLRTTGGHTLNLAYSRLQQQQHRMQQPPPQRLLLLRRMSPNSLQLRAE